MTPFLVSYDLFPLIARIICAIWEGTTGMAFCGSRRPPAQQHIVIPHLA